MTREQWAKMSGEERRIKIARICGWAEFAKNEPFANITGRWRMSTCRAKVPDYLNDLNAMHEAEKTLVDKWMVGIYGDILKRVVDLENPLFHATAAQRAKAFALTMEPE